MTYLSSLARRDEVVDYYAPEDGNLLLPCALKCGRLEHRLSGNGLCAACEAAGWADELQYRWLTNPTNTAALVAAEIELRVWQNHAKEGNDERQS